VTPTKAQQGHNQKGTTVPNAPKIQVFYPASLRFGEREAFVELRKRGFPAQDAMRALQQRRGDRTTRDALQEQNRRGMQHSLVDID
jgi:hypothetical protein